MPLYEFECSTCGLDFEKTLPVNYNHSAIRCPAGHRNVHRKYSAPSVVFKGSGFYKTDHRSGAITNENK